MTCDGAEGVSAPDLDSRVVIEDGRRFGPLAKRVQHETGRKINVEVIECRRI